MAIPAQESAKGHGVPEDFALSTCAGSAAYIEGLYGDYVRHPDKTPPQWRAFFDQMGRMSNGSAPPVIDSPAPASSSDRTSAIHDSMRAMAIMQAYRVQGHLAARLDPLDLSGNPGPIRQLDPASYGFGPEDMDRPILMDQSMDFGHMTLRALLARMRQSYCSTLGVQFTHISDPREKEWIEERIERRCGASHFTKTGRLAILKKLIEAEAFERFLHRRYPGTKRFGIDGAESMVPALEQIIKRGGSLGVRDIVLGMPHRGRLNVLAAVMGKPYHVIFHEFQGGSTHGSGEFGSGDVKYHLGTSTDRQFDGNSVHLSLAANPSHLEAIDPVVIGKARAKQAFYLEQGLEKNKESGRGRVMPLLIHGDAAFAGQGVVSECLALSGLAGYRTGGTIHFIVNNQIGFTTSPHYSRSSPYPSDVALQVQAPIFHINGDDPEAVVHAAKIATEYRQAFGKDVVIDMFCYRRYGHNEGDEPMFTQPLMYTAIAGHATTREIYARRLVEDNVIADGDDSAILAKMSGHLEAEFEKGKKYAANSADWLNGKWIGKAVPVPADDDRRGTTGVDTAVLRDLGESLCRIPDDVDPHKTVRRIYRTRFEAIASGKNIDWSNAEMLAFATLLNEGFPLRLSGQDSARGTFSQRHGHIVDQKSGKIFIPLHHVSDALCEVIDSPLSEEAVVGFEYGYSLVAPDTLTLWEAQFGDFANGAQVLFDQFISAGERKWLRMSGLVCLLPHGYEGQGPEHSSARLERFLQLCGQDNMQIANCTTPANYFHVLRRQIHRNFRKPLILMTPKSLLRHKKCVSSIEEIGASSSFHRVLWDDADAAIAGSGTTLDVDDKIRRVILCSGKVYYDLLEERERTKMTDVYLLRIEQLFPFPFGPLLKELGRFSQAEFVWAQEEPKNMGAWTFIDTHLERIFAKLSLTQARPVYIGRAASASTAAGSKDIHDKELAALLADAFAV